MQITIRGSDRRVKFTKREVAVLRLAANLMAELVLTCDDAGPAGVHLSNVIGRISQDGTYREPESTPDEAG